MQVHSIVGDCAVVNPNGGGTTVALSLGQPFEHDNPIVLAYPWAFDLSGVESASANPGERRNARRSPKIGTGSDD